jgi:hypothetical protein
LALAVERGEGRTFKDILKGVRDAVTSRPGSEVIQCLRSTREDKLLIVLNKDDQARDRVLKLLEGQSLKVSQVGPRPRTEVIHLRGLDELGPNSRVFSQVTNYVI